MGNGAGDPRLRARVLPVRLMIFDVDGVLTDGSIIYHDDGSESKIFHVHDGHGIRLIQRVGIEVAFITGRSCKAVEHRARNLGITRLYQGIHHKVEVYERLLSDTGFVDQQVGYVGDDLIDVPVLRRVGFPVAVSGAAQDVIDHACYVTTAKGGRGACREVCELLLKIQGLWEQATWPYLGKETSAI
ncbi:MAG: HAD hydrolase family protein [Deltaproteobacteria bacterium]|nr:HAD hydrolase family protein [Deltaproteobacteria bacterium]